MFYFSWIFFFFFFKQKTAYEMRISDWSSDVCSSDLSAAPAKKPTISTESCFVTALMLVLRFVAARKPNNPSFSCRALRKRRLLVLPICLRAVRRASVQYVNAQSSRSEERREGKECVSRCRSRWSRDH